MALEIGWSFFCFPLTVRIGLSLKCILISVFHSNIGCLYWHAAEHSTILTQTFLNVASLFCLQATTRVLMSKHPSLSYPDSNNRCEPFKDGCITVQKIKVDVTGTACSKTTHYKRAWPLPQVLSQGIRHSETIPISNPRPMGRRNST